MRSQVFTISIQQTLIRNLWCLLGTLEEAGGLTLGETENLEKAVERKWYPVYQEVI